MKKKLLATAFAAALSIGSASASDHDEMEKCKVVDKDGKGLIKEHRGDCGGGKNTCQSHNIGGDPEAWILVPKGECDKINKGDFSGVSDEIKDKIEMDKMTEGAEDMMDKAEDMMDEMKEKMEDK